MEFRISDCRFRIEEIWMGSISYHQSKIQNPKSPVQSLHHSSIPWSDGLQAYSCRHNCINIEDNHNYTVPFAKLFGISGV